MSTALSELGRKFRYTIVRIAEQLTDPEREGIIFAEQIPSHCVKGQSNKSLAVLSRLEAEGHFSPVKPQGLHTLLKEISRCDLQDQVTAYMSSREYKLATKDAEKKRSKSSRKERRDPKNCQREADERQTGLMRELRLTYDPMSLAKHAFAVTLTQVGLLLGQVELVRETIFNSISSDPDPELRRDRAIHAMQEVEEGVEKVAKSLRKALSAAGLKSSNSSCTEDPEEDYDHLPASLPSTPQDSPVSSPRMRRRPVPTPRSPQPGSRLQLSRIHRQEKANEKPDPITWNGSGSPDKLSLVTGREELPNLSNRQMVVHPKAAGCDAPGSPLLQKTLAQACAEKYRNRSESEPHRNAAGLSQMTTKGHRGSVPDITPDTTPPQSLHLPIHQHGPYMQEEAESDRSVVITTVSSADNTGCSSTDNTGDSGYAELQTWQEYRVNSTHLSVLDPHATVIEDKHSYTPLKTGNRVEEAIYDEPVTSKQVPEK